MRRVASLLACSLLLLGCVDENGETVLDDRASFDDQQSIAEEDFVLEREGRTAPDPDDLPLAAPSADPEPPERDDGHARTPGFDFNEPPPITEIAWTQKSVQDRSIEGLEYTAVNHTDEAKHFEVTLVWDSGTTESHAKSLGSFTLPPRGKEVRTLTGNDVPRQTAEGKYPGMILLGFQSPGDDAHILPTLYVMPNDASNFPAAKSWPFDLMTAEELQRANDELTGTPGGERIVQWSPAGGGPTQDEDGGPQ